MSIMISLEGQLYLSLNALQVAIALGITKNESAQELIKSNITGSGLILLFWNVWCSFCMLTTSLGRESFLMLSQISTPLPCKMPLFVDIDELSLSFMQLRVQLADIQTRVFSELYVSATVNMLCLENLEGELEKISKEVEHLRSYPIFEESLFFRSRVLMLELSSFRAQTCFLLYRPRLISRYSLQAVTVANSIIHQIWGHYTQQNSHNKDDIIKHLDWNFCYPLRTASITLFISCLILLRFKKSTTFLQERNFFEYKLALEVLGHLVQLLPIQKNLLDLITNIENIKEDKSVLRPEHPYSFWTCLFI